MRDLRLAVRSMRHRPGMSLLAIIALGLGIGLTTTMFSIVNGAVLRGLPFPESHRILHVAPFSIAEQDDMDMRVHTFAEFARRQQSFETYGALQMQTANVVGPDGQPERYSAAALTGNMLRLLRTAPLLGRDLRDDDNQPGAAPVALIGHKVWQERFKGAPDVVGQPLRINGTVMTVVGVMPEGFRFPSNQDIWPALIINPEGTKFGEGPGLETIGRLKPGVSRDQASVEMATLWRQLELEYPDRYKDHTAEVKTYIEEFIGSETIGALYTMLAAVFGVLVIACANVANLVMARAAQRTREIAVRTAVGASRWRVVKQMLVEVLVLATAGAALGLVLAQAGITLFNRGIVDTNPPFWIDIRIDTPVLLFVTFTAVVAALVSGIVPALRASRADLASVMNDEGRTTGVRMGRFSRVLVIGEIAVSFGLLVVSALIIQSIVNLGRADYGIATSDVWTSRATLPSADYPTDEKRLQLADALLARVAAVPSVTGVAVATGVPIGGPLAGIKFPDRQYASDRDYHQVHHLVASPDFFKVLRVAMLEGRAFDLRDRPGAEETAIVNRAFAAKYFPSGAVGQRFAMAEGRNTAWRTIVGVVPDLGVGMNPGDRTREGIYTPFAQLPLSGFTVLAQATGPPLQITAPVRDALRALDPNLPLFNVATVEEGIRRQSWPFRVFGSLFMSFGFAALFLATVGLYGVMSFSVSRRTQEIGVRMAMGAGAGDVLKMVLRQGLWQVVIGVLLGLGLGVGLGTAMQLLLFQVRPYDPVIFTIIAAVLGGTGLVACLVPARRAAAVDPMVALRYQ